jgi:hypothetical protein
LYSFLSTARQLALALFEAERYRNSIFLILILLELPSDIDKDIRSALEEAGMGEYIFGGLFPGLVETIHI